MTGRTGRLNVVITREGSLSPRSRSGSASPSRGGHNSVEEIVPQQVSVVLVQCCRNNVPQPLNLALTTDEKAAVQTQGIEQENIGAKRTQYVRSLDAHDVADFRVCLSPMNKRSVDAILLVYQANV